MANTELGYDIQTGRNVYVDKDKYESDDAYKARIDAYTRDGFCIVFKSSEEDN